MRIWHRPTPTASPTIHVAHAYRASMEPEIRTAPIAYTIFGHSLRHDPAKRFGEEIMALLGRVWPVIKAGAIPNDGLNRVVYERDGNETESTACLNGCIVFAGVALADTATVGPANAALEGAAVLERKTVRLLRYAYWKHVGPYHLIPTTGAAMTKSLAARGLRTGSPMVEVYGHWSPDESKLETETFVALQ